MTTKEIRTDSLRAWLLAARPKTLTGAAVPVMLGCGLAAADGGFVLLPAVLCLAFALLMQIDANLINDLWDYLKGSDGEDRLGPERACAQGWITPKSMRLGIAATTLAACAAGSLMVVQTALNIFGAMDLLPLTGVTLPFVSNGGSAMLASWGLLAFLKATDTRQNASFAIRLPSRREKESIYLPKTPGEEADGDA